MKMMNKVAAAVLASSMLAASSFAQSGTLSVAAAPSADEVVLSAVSNSDEVAVLPLAVAFLAGALLMEAAHHHFQQEALVPNEVPNESVDALFDL